MLIIQTELFRSPVIGGRSSQNSVDKIEKVAAAAVERLSSAAGGAGAPGHPWQDPAVDILDDEVAAANAVELKRRADKMLFRRVGSIQEHYMLMDDVFPNSDGHVSTTKRVCYAKGMKGKFRGVQFIIKQRHKTNSFKDDCEIADWLQISKLLYLLTCNPNNEANEALRFMTCSHRARVVDILEDGKYYFCVMEQVKGRDLFEYFINEKPHEKGIKPCLSIARSLAKEIAVALDRMHSMGEYVHLLFLLYAFPFLKLV